MLSAHSEIRGHIVAKGEVETHYHPTLISKTGTTLDTQRGAQHGIPSLPPPKHIPIRGMSDLDLQQASNGQKEPITRSVQFIT